MRHWEGRGCRLLSRLICRLLKWGKQILTTNTNITIAVNISYASLNFTLAGQNLIIQHYSIRSIHLQLHNVKFIVCMFLSYSILENLHVILKVDTWCYVGVFNRGSTDQTLPPIHSCSSLHLSFQTHKYRVKWSLLAPWHLLLRCHWPFVAHQEIPLKPPDILLATVYDLEKNAPLPPKKMKMFLTNGGKHGPRCLHKEALSIFNLLLHF